MTELKQTKVEKPISNKKSIGRTSKKCIIGLGLLLVVLSIAYSTVIVFTGIDSIVPKILVLPQAIFGAYIALKQFIK